MRQMERLQRGQDISAREDGALEPGWPPMPVRVVRSAQTARLSASEPADPRKTQIQEKISEAMAAIRRLQSDRPRGFKSCMPEPIRDASEIFASAVANGGKWESVVMVRLGATVDDIRLIDVVWGWLMTLDPFSRKLVAGRGNRVPWKALVKQDLARRSVRQLQRIYDDAIDQILCQISR
ncbi:MAG: hypothetical protein F8N39_11580 [Clostridiaceae bacterium]|nr:hypothetical protein [Clostridiaceae bacterium]